MTTTINKLVKEGIYSEADAKVFEIMEHLLKNVEESHTNIVYNWGNYELGTTRVDNKTHFIFGKGGKFYFAKANDKEWTLVESFIRQYLNNGFDGFGLLNVEECFDYIMDNLDFIIEQDMISETGWNNSREELWSNYRPEYPKVNYYTGEVEID